MKQNKDQWIDEPNLLDNIGIVLTLIATMAIPVIGYLFSR